MRPDPRLQRAQMNIALLNVSIPESRAFQLVLGFHLEQARMMLEQVAPARRRPQALLDQLQDGW